MATKNNPAKNRKMLLVILCAAALALAVTAGALLLVSRRKTPLRIAARPEVIAFFDENGITAALEKKTGAQIAWADYGADPYYRVKGDIGGEAGFKPDADLGLGLSDAQVGELARDCFLELTDPVLSGAGELGKRLAENTALAAQLRVDGGIYSFPSYFMEDYASQYPQKAWVNQEWLERLGAGLPTTTEQLRDLLERFRDEDPNGNGEKDEIPLGVAYIGGGHSTLGFLISAFLPTEFDLSDARPYLGLDGSGKVVSMAGDKRYQDALAFLHGLVEKGLLEKSVFTDPVSKLMAGAAGEEVYGVIAAADLNNVFQDISRAGAYAPLPPLNGAATVYQPAAARGGGYFVAKDSKQQKAALALGDALLSKELTLAVLSANQWEEADKKALALGGDAPIWKLKDGALLQAPFANLTVPFWFGEELALGQQAKAGADGSYSLDTAENWKGYLNKTSREEYAPYGGQWARYALPMVPLTGGQEAALEKDGQNLRRQVFEAVVGNGQAFVTGERPLSEWDEYLRELDALGLQEVVKVFAQANSAAE
jgi:putative aldouronate transport system substrate-binding protein